MSDTETQDEMDRKTSSRSKDIGAFEALWKVFSSMKTAVVLLLLLALVSIAGTLIKQNQPAEEYIKHYGTVGYNVFTRLGLTDVYHSSWFTILLALVGVNLAVCTINRFGPAWRRTFAPEIATDPDRIGRMARNETLTCELSVEEAAAKVAGALRAGSYRVAKRADGDHVSLYATRGRVSIWGPYLTHLSILVIFAGAAIGGLAGFEGRAIIEEGTDTAKFYTSDGQLEADLGFRVALRKFTIEHDKKHRVTGYKSDLRVYDNNKLVAKKVIDVNHPLTYKGISLFQSSYGLAALVLKLTAPNGEVEWIPYKLAPDSESEGLLYVVADEHPWKQVELDGKKLTVFVHNPLAPDYVGGSKISASLLPINPAAKIMISDRFPEHRGMDAWTSLGWVALGKSADYKGYTVTLDDVVDYTVLDVSRNPGLPVVYVGFALITVAVFISFYIMHRVVRVSISPGPKGAEVAVGATSRGDASVFDRDFERLHNVLEDGSS